MDYLSFVFYFFKFFVILSASFTISSRNPVHSVLFLVLTFINAAVLLLLVGAEFLALILVVVYVGAIAVLFLFVVMMLDVKTSILKQDYLLYFPVGLVVIFFLLYSVGYAFVSDFVFPFHKISFDYINFLTSFSTIYALSSVLYLYYFPNLVIAAFILFVAMIGSIRMTLSPDLKRNRKKFLLTQTLKDLGGLKIISKRLNRNSFNKVNSLFFQSPATPIMEGIIDLHNHIFFFLVGIFVFVATIFFLVIWDFWYVLRHPTNDDEATRIFSLIKINRVTHAPLLETVWTVIPSLILLSIVVPSFALLYAMDEVIEPTVTVKVIGHQWYWSYEIPTAFGMWIYDSYMLSEDELPHGGLRLLEVDNSLVLPISTAIRLIITSTDVLHSWAVPSLGVKVDAVPGRLNQIPVFIRREGVYRGQCSELCGVNHGFMPITIRAVAVDDFLSNRDRPH